MNGHFRTRLGPKVGGGDWMIDDKLIFIIGIFGCDRPHQIWAASGTVIRSVVLAAVHTRDIAFIIFVSLLFVRSGARFGFEDDAFRTPYYMFLNHTLTRIQSVNINFHFMHILNAQPK